MCVCLFRAKKIVLQGTNMAHLLELQALAMSLSLATKLVQDAGHTQVSSTSMQRCFSMALQLLF